jgi:transposase-like protein
MSRFEKTDGLKCPKCGSTEHQMKSGLTDCGSQRNKCGVCGCRYTPKPKERGMSKEIKEAAIRTYYSGVSGRGVGKIFKMSHINVMNWIKKNSGSVDKSPD